MSLLNHGAGAKALAPAATWINLGAPKGVLEGGCEPSNINFLVIIKPRLASFGPRFEDVDDVYF